MQDLRQQTSGLRDPFAWREALSPGISPASTARNSRAGSRTGGSGASTPRSATPPLSPARLGGPGSARSMGGLSAAGGYPGGPLPPYCPAPDGASARSSVYATPEPSARSSEFVSAYDASSSACASARTADAGGLYEPQLGIPAAHGGRDATAQRRRHHAYAAALDTFAPGEDAASASRAQARPAAEASMEPRQVLSAARHGRHKEVEAALVAGFPPDFVDSYGNTLFHVACQNGNKRIAKMAIKYGGDMNAQNGKGNTGLHFLFAYGYPDIGEYFIEKGADEHLPNESGKLAREGIR